MDKINDAIRQGEFTKNKGLLDSVLSGDLIFQRASKVIVDKETYLKEAENIEYKALENISIETKFNRCETQAISVVYVRANGKNNATQKEFDGIFKNVRFFRKERRFFLSGKADWKLYAWFNEVSENYIVDKKNKAPVRDEDYIGLWEFFEDRAQKIKERLWSVYSFHAAILISLIGFTFKEAFAGSMNRLYLIVASGAGIIYSIFVCFQLYDIKHHIDRNHDRANNVMFKIDGLKELIDHKSDNAHSNSSFKSNIYLKLVLQSTYLLLLGFIGLLIYFIFKESN